MKCKKLWNWKTKRTYTRESYGKDLVHLAIEEDNKKMVKFLIENVESVNIRGASGSTLLCWATRNGYKDIVELLIKKGVDVNAENERGEIALYFAIVSERDEEMVELFIRSGADVHKSSSDDIDLLGCAISRGNKQTIEFLFANGAYTKYKYDQCGNTPFHKVVMYSRKCVVEFFLKNGVHADAENIYGYTPLDQILSSIVYQEHYPFEGVERMEEVAKLLIRHMFFSAEKPKCLESAMRGVYLRCSEYWESCKLQLDSYDHASLSQFLKAKNLDEQVKMFCESQIVRNYCIKPEVLGDKYADLVDVTTNVANRVMKEIFLRNNHHWKYLINHYLPLADMQQGLAEKIQREINEESGVAFPSATAFINTDTDALQPPSLQSLVLSKLLTPQSDISFEDHIFDLQSKKSKLCAGIGATIGVSIIVAGNALVKAATGCGTTKLCAEREQGSVLKNIPTLECLKEQCCRLGNVILQRC